MNRLQTELHRLYRVHPAADRRAEPESAELIDADGKTRALVLELARPADWEPLARVWRGVQADLGLPAPAVAVSGTDGLQLWFSLADSIPAGDAHAFLESLRLRYLSDLPPARVRLLPTETSARPAASAHAAPAPSAHAALVPAEQAEEGRWSAFVAPDLAAIFTETPWLDIPPSADGQAELLCRLKSIGRSEFDEARARLAPALAPAAPAAGATQEPPSGARVGHAAAAETQALTVRTAGHAGAAEAREFLLQVMRDHTVELALRIEAAKALLPRSDDAASRRGS
jgi:hypothetical protein